MSKFFEKSCINFQKSCEIQFCLVIKQNIPLGGACRESKCKAPLLPLPPSIRIMTKVSTQNPQHSTELGKRNDIVATTNTTKQSALMKMIAKGKLTFHVIWNLFSCKKLQIFLFSNVPPESSPGKKKNNLQNLLLLARRENANSWKLFEIGAAQQFVKCWESDFTFRTPFHSIPTKFNLQFSFNSVLTMNRNRIKV